MIEIADEYGDLIETVFPIHDCCPLDGPSLRGVRFTFADLWLDIGLDDSNSWEAVLYRDEKRIATRKLRKPFRRYLVEDLERLLMALGPGVRLGRPFPRGKIPDFCDL